ncbi:Hint domain-containing protein [Roseovarius sp. SCSIO 43702]|uniref:Hint domain-containing protein n=1 Tax=Roseovarius sp. SCSIO 43702 TaxID=2823043 RepID=UPI001C733574|nr:Hint domain-containing protein [Roseovarius sp. SCSIO 43702]QYX57190.1 Hint domain-containing protein [Roseovarius sp. SCSIO 43702]
MKPKTVGRSHGQAHADASQMTGGVPLGSIILTMSGEMPVEHVMPGDRIITRDTGAAIVRNVLRHRRRCRAVRILAGSLGDTRPECDVTLPEDQPVHVRDWRAEALFGAKEATVRAGALIDGEYITALGEIELEVVTLIFDRAHVLYVDGLEVAGHIVGQTVKVAA